MAQKCTDGDQLVSPTASSNDSDQERNSSDRNLLVYTTLPLEHNGVFLADASPFVHKLLAYLCLANVAFSVRPVAWGNPSPPKGKRPFVQLPTGELIGDSQIILEELERRRPAGEQLDAWLSAEQRALSHVVRRTLEESTYWNAGIERRWRRWSNFFGVMVPMLFGQLPRWLRLPLGWFLRRSVLHAYFAQGMSRHSREEILALGREDIAAVEVLFPSAGPFFHGPRASSIDVVLHGFVKALMFQAAAFECEEASAEAELERRCPRLLGHAVHMDSLLDARLRQAVGR